MANYDTYSHTTTTTTTTTPTPPAAHKTNCERKFSEVKRAQCLDIVGKKCSEDRDKALIEASGNSYSCYIVC